MIDEDRMRARLQHAIGYEPPGPGFGAQPVSSLIGSELARPKGSERPPSGLLAFVAALLAVAIVVTLVIGARTLHLAPTIPVHPAPHLPLLIKSNNPPCGGPGSSGPLTMFTSGAGWASGPSYAGDVTGQTVAKGPYRTSDGGTHWVKVAPPAIPNLSPDGETEFFLDATHAWVAEAAGSARATADHVVVFSTNDAGKTWQESSALQITPIDPKDVIWSGSGYAHWLCFIDPHNGVLLIESGPASPMAPLWRTGALYRTLNGGLSWTLVSTNPGSAALKTLGGRCAGAYGIGDGLVFSSSVTGWLPLLECASPNAVLVTHDGGVTWSVQRMPGNYPTLPYFIDSDHAFALGSNSTVVVATSDSGATWVTQGTLPDQGNDVTFIDPTHGWCIGHPVATPGNDWNVYRTTDGGHTWVLETRVASLGWLTFVDATTGYQSVGEYPGSPDWMLFKTIDGGLTWSRIE